MSIPKGAECARNGNYYKRSGGLVFYHNGYNWVKSSVKLDHIGYAIKSDYPFDLSLELETNGTINSREAAERVNREKRRKRADAKQRKAKAEAELIRYIRMPSLCQING